MFAKKFPENNGYPGCDGTFVNLSLKDKELVQHFTHNIEMIVLASGSEVRRHLLTNAGVRFDVHHPRVDEEALKAALVEEQASPRDIADALAELKAAKISSKFPSAFVVGCDQVLAFNGALYSKPESQDGAFQQLMQMRGESHKLLSAVVVFEDTKPVWRHVSEVELKMRNLSESYLQDYVVRNWDSIRHSVGAYKIEEEGVRLFSHIRGDYFSILGLPLLELLSYLELRGELDS